MRRYRSIGSVAVLMQAKEFYTPSQEEMTNEALRYGPAPISAAAAAAAKRDGLILLDEVGTIPGRSRNKKKR